MSIHFGSSCSKTVIFHSVGEPSPNLASLLFHSDSATFYFCWNRKNSIYSKRFRSVRFDLTRLVLIGMALLTRASSFLFLRSNYAQIALIVGLFDYATGLDWRIVRALVRHSLIKKKHWFVTTFAKAQTSRQVAHMQPGSLVSRLLSSCILLTVCLSRIGKYDKS